MENFSYEMLWRTYQAEKQTNQLTGLQRDFYDNAKAYVSSMADSPGAPQGRNQNTKENSMRLLNEIFQRRKQKIAIYAAYNKPLPQPISSIELKFYEALLGVMRGCELGPGAKGQRSTALRALKDIPEIILPSGERAGPFKKDQEVSVSGGQQDIAFLVENSICAYS